jgi:hypothetical protein
MAQWREAQEAGPLLGLEEAPQDLERLLAALGR